MSMFSKTNMPGTENSARFRSPRATPFSLDQSTSERNCRSYLINSPASKYLRGHDSKGFCQRAAHYLGEINALHPIREGNGRAQREFIRELAVESGYEIAWDLITQDEMLAAPWQVFTEEATKRLQQS